MQIGRPLDDLFRSRSHIRVLRALDALPPGLAVSARDLARRSGLSHPTASSVLRFLSHQGLVLARRAPHADAFELNRAHVLTPKLMALFEWERQLRGELVAFLCREITRHTHAVSAAYLFGSAVGNEMAAASDIDVAIVCPTGKEEDVEAAMEPVATAVRNRFGNHLNAIIRSSPVGPTGRPGKGHRLWARIVSEGIPVIDAGSASMKQSSRAGSSHG